MKFIMPAIVTLLVGCAAAPEIISSSTDNVVVYAPPSVTIKTREIVHLPFKQLRACLLPILQGLYSGPRKSDSGLS